MNLPTAGTERPFAISHHTFPWMDVTIVTDGQEAAVTVSGEADMSNADEFARLISEASAECRSVRIDIAGLTFLDSSMLRALLMCQARLAARDVDVKVCRPTPQAHRIFEMTNLLSLLE